MSSISRENNWWHDTVVKSNSSYLEFVWILDALEILLSWYFDFLCSHFFSNLYRVLTNFFVPSSCLLWWKLYHNNAYFVFFLFICLLTVSVLQVVTFETLKSPWIFFNFDCSGLESVFWCFLIVQDKICMCNQMVKIKAREIIRIWRKRKWNYSLIWRVYHLITY